MRRPITLALVYLALLPALNPPAARAHDDGLTCHSHPSRDSNNFRQLGLALHSFNVDFGLAVHAFESHAERALREKRPGFDHAQVREARRGLGEFERMLVVVQLLLDRAAQARTELERFDALATARGTFNALPLARYVDFADFQPGGRSGTTVIVPMDRLVAFLEQTHGIAPELLVILEDAAASC